MKRSIATAVLGLLLATTAHADLLRGSIVRHAGDRFLQLPSDPGTTPKLLTISTTTPDIQSNLTKLKDGDFLVARGAISADQKSVQIQSIESLGLAALVGTWATDRLEVYEFHDFSQLTLYVPSTDGQSQIVKAGEFSYAVTPDKGARYAIFLSDNRSVTLGSIEFRKSRVLLTLIDPKTGQVSSELTLSPFATQQPLK